MYCTRKINDDYTWVGADCRRLAMFEGVYDVPQGISFNSYLLTDEKTVLFDTVDSVSPSLITVTRPASSGPKNWPIMVLAMALHSTCVRG